MQLSQIDMMSAIGQQDIYYVKMLFYIRLWVQTSDKHRYLTL